MLKLLESGHVEEGKRANYQNQLKLLKTIVDKPVIWPFWLQCRISEGCVSTFCLVKPSGKIAYGFDISWRKHSLMFSLVVFFFPLYIHLSPTFHPFSLFIVALHFSLFASCIIHHPLALPFVLVWWSNLYFSVSPCVRPSAGDILWASVLVLYLLLWAQPASRRDLPCLAALADSGRLHRPLQLRTLLSGPVVERQPQCICGADTQAYR